MSTQLMASGHHLHQGHCLSAVMPTKASASAVASDKKKPASGGRSDSPSSLSSGEDAGDVIRRYDLSRHDEVLLFVDPTDKGEPTATQCMY